MATTQDVINDLDQLGLRIDILRAEHDRSLDTLNVMRVLLMSPIDAVLKVNALKAALDLYDRPFEDATEDECPSCGKLAVLDGSRNGAMTFAAPVCYDCRNPERQPQSQAERDGDA